MQWLWQDGPRLVRLDYAYWTGVRRVSVDGEEIARARNLAWRWSHRFRLGDAPAELRVRIRWLVALDAELEVDGRVVQPAAAPREIPAWVWLFAAANAAILVVAGGGAIPGALAGAGAASSIGIARTSLSAPARLGLCALVTAAAWAGFYGLLQALGG